jgi:hypothetical protein
MIKIQKHLKRENACTSYPGHPTVRPQAVLNPDLLGNPTRHKRSRRPSTSSFVTSQRKYRHI